MDGDNTCKCRIKRRLKAHPIISGAIIAAILAVIVITVITKSLKCW